MYLRTKQDVEERVRQIDTEIDDLYRGGQGDEKALRQEKEELVKLKILKLRVAFNPAQVVTDEVWQWIAWNVGEGVILDFELDRAVVGGAEVYFEGRFGDYTVRKKFNDMSF